MSGDGIPLPLQRRARLRAGNRCEYCGVPQAGQEATFHIDHVVPRRSGGPTELDNLALACVSCSLRKGARTDVLDPVSGDMAPLFNPRRDSWAEHFELAEDGRILAKTPAARVSVALLKMNRPVAIEIRRRLRTPTSPA